MNIYDHWTDMPKPNNISSITCNIQHEPLWTDVKCGNGWKA